MVGKSRGSRHGETRTTTGGAAGGGTVGVPQDRENVFDAPSRRGQQQNIVEDAMQAETPREQSARSHTSEEDILSTHQADAVTASMGMVEGAAPDLTGRGTPGGKISDLAQGRRPNQTEVSLGVGGHNLGVRHGRTEQGGDIAGAGASMETSRREKPEQDQAEK